VVDKATVVQTKSELEAEIATLKKLERMAKEVRILIASDATGEGINLQRAHLMD
jgi:hypothetical protein